MIADGAAPALARCHQVQEREQALVQSGLSSNPARPHPFSPGGPQCELKWFPFLGPLLGWGPCHE